MTFELEKTQELEHYLSERSSDRTEEDCLAVIKKLVHEGANPNRMRQNLFQEAYNRNWGKNSWIELIDLCQYAQLKPNRFTYGLTLYMQLTTNYYYLSRELLLDEIDPDVIQKFVDNGAYPHVTIRTRLDRDALKNNRRWDKEQPEEFKNLTLLDCATSKDSISRLKNIIKSHDIKEQDKNAKITQVKVAINKLEQYAQKIYKKDGSHTARLAGRSALNLVQELHTKLEEDIKANTLFTEHSSFKTALITGRIEMSKHRRVGYFHKFLIEIASIFQSMKSCLTKQTDSAANVGDDHRFFNKTTRQKLVDEIDDALKPDLKRN